MPVVDVDPDRLQALLSGKVDEATLRATIPKLGADIEDADGQEWRVEFFPDRPDLFTVEGVARALRAYLEIEPGLARYDVAEPTTHVDVDAGLEGIRPFIGGAFVSDLRLDDDAIQALMSLQEDLHWGLGSRRRKVAIGVHDADPVTPPLTYEAVDRDEIEFTPLLGPEERTSVGEAMTPGEILDEHPKGREFAAILEGHDRVPIILDDDRNVLSFPPVINGTLTALTAGTTDLFIDTTGTDLQALTKVLDVLVTHLAEAGGEIEAVEVRSPFHDDLVTPDLAPRSRRLDVDDANDWLGTDLDAAETADALRRLAYGAEPDGDAVEVQVPAYRADILHDVDLHEDVAIGLGFETLQPAQPSTPTTGRGLARRDEQRRLREVLTGLGFLEAMSLTLTSPEVHFERTRRTVSKGVDLDNPVSKEQSVPRRDVLPSLLDLLSRNTHRDLPQRFFETGVVLDADGKSRHRVAFVEAASDVGFTEVKGYAEAVVEDALDAGFDVEAAEDPLLVDGRAAAVRVDGDDRGILGEVHPEVLERFEIETPVVACEIRLD